MIKPRQFNIYKGLTGKQGALQMNLARPKDEGFDLGGVFLEMTNAVGMNKYDWKNSIRFRLDVNDLSEVVFGLKTMTTGGKIELLHDPGAGTDKKGQVIKTLNISSPKGPRAGVIINLSEKKGQDIKKHTVGLCGHEAMAFGLMLERAIIAAHGW